MTAPDPQAGLTGLAELPLFEHHEALLAELDSQSRGSPMWRRRKSVELRELLTLSQIASRLTIEALDATTDLRAMVRLRCTVPCRPDPDGELVVQQEALLGISFREESMRTPLPGYAFVEILEPEHVFLAVVPPKPPQLLCLGSTLPVGLPIRELILSSYGALTMQNFLIDERDPAGVMNGAAALWWQQRTGLIPLSSVPFLSDADLDGEVRP